MCQKGTRESTGKFNFNRSGWYTSPQLQHPLQARQKIPEAAAPDRRKSRKTRNSAKIPRNPKFQIPKNKIRKFRNSENEKSEKSKNPKTKNPKNRKIRKRKIRKTTPHIKARQKKGILKRSL